MLEVALVVVCSYTKLIVGKAQNGSSDSHDHEGAIQAPE